MAYQDVITAGPASKINSLILREYLHNEVPIPKPPPRRDLRGALCELHVRGIVKDVWHADVSSLYPSTMLAFDCLPSSDSLGVVGRALTDLRNYRLACKRAVDHADDAQTVIPLKALQAAFKIIITSMYGYLSCEGMNFANPRAAEMVTAIGRNIITRMRDWIASHGANVIELDTDGLYFSKPPDVTIAELKRGLTDALPRAIEVEFARYNSMFSYEMKNHALLDGDGRVIIKGSALRSRSREPYLSIYQGAVLSMMLRDGAAEIPALFDSAVKAVRSRSIPLAKLTRSEELSESVDEYRRRVEAGERSRSPSYEAVIASGERSNVATACRSTSAGASTARRNGIRFTNERSSPTRAMACVTRMSSFTSRS